MSESNLKRHSYAEFYDECIKELKDLSNEFKIEIEFTDKIVTDSFHSHGRRIVPYGVVGVVAEDQTYIQINKINFSSKSIYIIAKHTHKSETTVLEKTMENLRIVFYQRLETPKLAVFLDDVDKLLLWSLE